MEVTAVLLGISLILFFGFFAEYLFKRFNVPDILFLILLGVAIGPYGLHLVHPNDVLAFAPAFTTFTLLFLLFDGSFNIDLSSFAKGLSKALSISAFNFFTSSIIIAGLMYFFVGDQLGILLCVLTGFILGGVSSTFVIPIIKQMPISKNTYSILTIESALTDVFTIIFSLTIIEFIKLQTFELQLAFSALIAHIAVAFLIGVIGGTIWILLESKVIKENKSYIITVAFLIFIYVITDFVGGNGPIAALVFGLVLRNSKQLTSIAKGITTRKPEDRKGAIDGDLGVSVTTPSEQFFYDQISFFLKTFFFVYIGLLLNLAFSMILIIGVLIALIVMLLRNFTWFFTKQYGADSRKLICSLFARGIAAAAIAQQMVYADMKYAIFISAIVNVVITATIIFSSIRIFLLKRNMLKPENQSGK